MTSKREDWVVPAPPHVQNYRVKFTYDSDNIMANYGQVLCTVCGDLVEQFLEFSRIQDWGFLSQKISRHNRAKHPDLLYVLTSEGWCRIKDVLPETIVYRDAEKQATLVNTAAQTKKR